MNWKQDFSLIRFRRKSKLKALCKMKRSALFALACCATFFMLCNWYWALLYTWEDLYNFKSPTLLQDVRKSAKFSSSKCVSTCCTKEEITISRCLDYSHLYGKVPTETRYLTIGIPTILRKKGKYLQKTLKSLIENLDINENNITIVVLFTDSDEELRKLRASEIATLFKHEIESGLLLLTQTLPQFYPTTKITRRTYNDTVERIRWRSKQVLDFAFLLACAQNSAEYFLILEDDVETTEHYITSIRNFVYEKRKSDWVSLSFSGFLIIGLLLKSEHMKRLSDFLVMFRLEKPVDLLIMQFIDLLSPDSQLVTRRVPGLFQHIGLFSSLEGKVQKLKDRNFENSSYAFNFKNPLADIVSTLGVHQKHYPEHCYGQPNKFFWGSAPKRNDTFDVILHKPLKLNRIFVSSGRESHERDIIKHAELKVSHIFKQMLSNQKADCDAFFTLALFENGKVDVQLNDMPEIQEIQCIRIEFFRNQSSFILINEIAVDAVEDSD